MSGLIPSIILTLKLAFVSTAILLLLVLLMLAIIPHVKVVYRNLIMGVINLPLVLPPTVLGYYLLIIMTSENASFFPLKSFAFTFEGLVIGAVIYSFPFVYQPIQNSVNAVNSSYADLAASMGASSFDRFITVTLPLAKDGFIAAAILGFAHTIGEFGVVLMIGGNIPGETQVLSVLLYEYVEMGDYESAHALSAILLGVSFMLLFAMYRFTGSASSLFAVGSKPSYVSRK